MKTSLFPSLCLLLLFLPSALGIDAVTLKTEYDVLGTPVLKVVLDSLHVLYFKVDLHTSVLNPGLPQG